MFWSIYEWAGCIPVTCGLTDNVLNLCIIFAVYLKANPMFVNYCYKRKIRHICGEESQSVLKNVEKTILYLCKRY